MPLGSDISASTKDSLLDFDRVTIKEILGPRFQCPTCLTTLLVAPTRSVLVEALLSKLPDEPEALPSDADSTVTGPAVVDTRANESVDFADAENEQDKEAHSERPVDWSNYLGRGVGNGSEGHRI